MIILKDTIKNNPLLHNFSFFLSFNIFVAGIVNDNFKNIMHKIHFFVLITSFFTHICWSSRVSMNNPAHVEGKMVKANIAASLNMFKTFATSAKTEKNLLLSPVSITAGTKHVALCKISIILLNKLVGEGF